MNAAFDFAFFFVADGVDATCVLVMGGAVPQLHSYTSASSSSSLVAKKPFAVVPSCVCGGRRNWLRLPARRSDVAVSHGVRWSVPAGRRSHCPPVCASATVSTRPYDGLAEDREDFIKAGGEELDLVQLQANKSFEQPKIADKVTVGALHRCLLFLRFM